MRYCGLEVDPFRLALYLMRPTRIDFFPLPSSLNSRWAGAPFLITPPQPRAIRRRSDTRPYKDPGSDLVNSLSLLV